MPAKDLIGNIPASRSLIKQLILLGELVFVMVPDSVEEERMHSAMKFLKNSQRNKLGDGYLTACVRTFKNPRAHMNTFPFKDYKDAVKAWLAGATKHGRYGLGVYRCLYINKALRN
jgi:hypothetical protein